VAEREVVGHLSLVGAATGIPEYHEPYPDIGGHGIHATNSGEYVSLQLLQNAQIPNCGKVRHAGAGTLMQVSNR
jgi:hypothetical protein